MFETKNSTSSTRHIKEEDTWSFSTIEACNEHYEILSGALNRIEEKGAHENLQCSKRTLGIIKRCIKRKTRSRKDSDEAPHPSAIFIGTSLANISLPNDSHATRLTQSAVEKAIDETAKQLESLGINDSWTEEQIELLSTKQGKRCQQREYLSKCESIFILGNIESKDWDETIKIWNIALTKQAKIHFIHPHQQKILTIPLKEKIESPQPRRKHDTQPSSDESTKRSPLPDENEKTQPLLQKNSHHTKNTSEDSPFPRESLINRLCRCAFGCYGGQ